ncbi:MAG: FAD-dependent oxidoreductase [Deltaproteobacteria bacterium]|nr:FAD-dependent oxidoreductase [Deltaproteobacteria bacterium]
MAKTELFRALRRAARRAAAATKVGMSIDDAAEAARRRGPSRREVLRGTLGALALAPLVGCGDNALPPAVPAPVIAIVGGGAAGLHCAYQLRKAGVIATVYEAAGRTGGRMFTASDKFAGGMVAELGGELVDSDHDTMIALAAQFGLVLDDLHAEEADLGLDAELFHFDGAPVSAADLATAFTPVAMKMSMAVTASDADATEFDRLDAMSISDWLADEAGLAPTALIRRILEQAYVGEYGLEVAQQSAFNLLYLIDHDTPDPFRVFGDSDERYHLRKGSQAIPDALAGELDDGQIVLDHKLVAVVAESDGRTTLTFDTAGGSVEVTADHVVFALPFTMLRACDLSAAGLPADKKTIIDTLGYGTNAKLMTGYGSRPWRTQNASGTSITDHGELQATWDTSRGQPGTTGILTNFVGGDRGVAMGEGTAEERAAEILPWVDTLYPGAQAAYTAGSALRMHWPTQPFVLGSYACYKPGQTSFSGNEGARVGNLHFCGEHTSQDYQGYMEGSCETGAMAAGEILDDLGIPHGALLARVLAPKLTRPQGAYHASHGQRRRKPVRR